MTAEKVNNDELDTALQREAEPEGGPRARAHAFLQQRFAPLGPRPEPDVEAAEAAAAPALPGDDDLPLASPLPAHFRRTRIRQYRQQQAQSGPPVAPISEAVEAGAAPVAQPNSWVPLGPTVVREGQGGTKPAVCGRTVPIFDTPIRSTIYVYKEQKHPIYSV